MAESSDATLLLRFQKGNAGALTALLTRYERLLFHFLLGILRDHHLAEDVLQETFVRALQRLDGVDPAHLRGWLFTVAYHQAMLCKRKQKNRPAQALVESVDAPTPEPGPFELVEMQDDLGRMRRLLDLLPVPQREVICQRVYQGKRFREIAADLNCPLNTTLARMHEGLKRLRLLWEKDHVRP
jgi:RNA polymerase sigma-70 factor, ECF subfamily